MIGVLHPGEMGAELGRALRERGHAVGWMRRGRSDATRERARAAGLVELQDVRACEVLLSVVPLGAVTFSSMDRFEGRCTPVRGAWISPSAAMRSPLAMVLPVRLVAIASANQITWHFLRHSIPLSIVAALLP